MTYLDDMTIQDIPKKKFKEPLLFKQFVPSKEDFRKTFDNNIPILTIWDDLHVFVYHHGAKNTRSLVYGPMIAKVSPKKVFGFQVNSGRIESELSAIVDMNDIVKVSRADMTDIMAQFHDNIVEGDMPWVENKQAAIIKLNELNGVMKMLSTFVPDLAKDSFSAMPMSQAIREMYAIE